MLANTLQLHAYDGRYHETNKRWSSTIFVPEDGGHRHTFLINSHPAVLDGFASDYRAELARLHLFGAEHCTQFRRTGFTGRVLVLSPDTWRDPAAAGEPAVAGLQRFWLSPPCPWPSVLCTSWATGRQGDRSEFLGIIATVHPRLGGGEAGRLRQNQGVPAMGEMTM